MAEPVSSIVTLATVSVAIIQKTARFIEEARVIDASITRLHDSLRDLQTAINLVDSTCEVAMQSDPSLNQDIVQNLKSLLKRCRHRLKEIQKTVKELVDQQPSNLFERVVLTIRSNGSRRDVEKAILDVTSLMNQINTNMNCWSLRINAAMERRTSEAQPTQRVLSVGTELEQIAEARSSSPTSRRLSDAPTAHENDLTIPNRSSSSTTCNSRVSVSSSSSWPSTDYERRQSTTSDLGPVKENSEWVDFHVQIQQCGGKETQIEAIKTALGRSPQSSALVNSKDGTQRSPLHMAAQRGDVKLGRILLQFAADVNAKDKYGCSVLDLAVQHNETRFVAFLLNNNVDVTGISEKYRERFQQMQGEIQLRKTSSQKKADKRPDKKTTKTHKPQQSSRFGVFI